LSLFHSFANRAARFISAYAAGFTGGDIGYLKTKYSGHRMLPYSLLQEIKASIL
ncbi:hypothetical protein F5880DRAFT_1493628, partial [Lentinula raphanica]